MPVPPMAVWLLGSLAFAALLVVVGREVIGVRKVVGSDAIA
jgi:hypothetical protein